MATEIGTAADRDQFDDGVKSGGDKVPLKTERSKSLPSEKSSQFGRIERRECLARTDPPLPLAVMLNLFQASP